MTQEERLDALLRVFLEEKPEYRNISVPGSLHGRKRLLRSLMNVRPPAPLEKGILALQDSYLQEELSVKGVTDPADLTPITGRLYLWRGDITSLRADAVVNAANSGMIGCFVPCHGCIDNAIHSAAGVQLRLACAALMERQGTPEPVGRAKITPAFNLPSRYVLHTVGPYIQGELTEKDCSKLADCYRSCLELAAQHSLHSVAFCCISTGEFHFPPKRAAEIAVRTVRDFLVQSPCGMEVVFNVFKESDERIYRELLRAD